VYSTMYSSQRKSKSAGDVIGYATGLLALLACIAFMFFAFKNGMTKNATTALAVCFVASVINYYFMSSGYSLFNHSSLSMAEINKQ
jgi:predicted membrane channel-forming protein YqfA (hemolysin III family)